MPRTLESPYLVWATTRPSVTYDLAPSDVPPSVPADFGHEDVAAPIVNHSTGWPPLREAVARRYGVTPDAIAFAPGTSGANMVVMSTLLSRGDHVIVEHPVYDPLYVVPESLGATVSFVARRPETGFALDLDAIRAAMTPATKLIVITNLHNPIGVRTSNDTLRELAAIAEANDAYVLVDEVYLEWLRDDPSVEDGAPAAATLSPRMITTTSFTKAFGVSAWHIGWSLATPELAKRFQNAALLLGANASHRSERFVARALEQAATLVVPMREQLERHRALVREWVATVPGAYWPYPAGGTQAFIDLGGGDTRPLADRLVREYDTAVVPGYYFGAPSYIRLGLGVKTEILREGLARITKAMG